ncbi:hypothetical protein MVEN_00252100 [Mycena venus]|uniref:NAD(P)-binding protein n=1 Tax=Mycena venus TaxID=2733690 RepID=A0A8H6Z2F1_9AGAR|nr:hypothetical protein MVEN_00252100 [Mycena venus]
MAALKGIVLVTGAAQGIGRCIALRLADDGFGVAEEEVGKMVEEVVQQHGGLDVMVANAGVTGIPGVPFTQSNVSTPLQVGFAISSHRAPVPSEEWDRVMNINARGTFLCYKYAGIQMVKQGRGGRIIGACSIAGKKGMLMQGPYCASKFAVRGLTQAAALEYGAHSITVNAYAPSAIDTPLLSQASVTGDSSEIIKKVKDKLMALMFQLTVKIEHRTVAYQTNRVAVPDDIASLVSFLASKESQFITGQSISVNGGIYFD